MPKKIAFIFALPIRTNPALITMPFGLNVIKLLDKKGYKIDVYLSEYKSSSYDYEFSERVTVHFLDHNYMWPKEGKWSYYSLTTYFRWISFFKLRNKYSHVFASGMAGITLGGILKRTNRKSKFIYMNDEFPDQGITSIWVKSEIRFAKRADFVSTPDESRFPPLCKQIRGLSNKKHFTLPNTPLMEDVENLPIIDWHEYFKIAPAKKIFLMAGGLQEFNQISELITSLQHWPENTVLILKGKNDVKGFKQKHSDLSEKIIWSSESFSPDKLHSLIKYCSASLCLYKHINDNLTYVGKSSGKLMRSVILGKPVITSTSDAFRFVEEMNIGIMTNSTGDIANAIRIIIERGSEMEKNCRDNYFKISFESYWEKFEAVLFD